MIPPEVRAAIGFLAGLGLLAGGVLMKRRELAGGAYAFLRHRRRRALHSVTFACRSVYHFPLFGPCRLMFALMAAITAAAFTLAVQLDALVVAILGLVGGFLTPILLSTGQDNPAALFSYVALLDLGLVAVALRREVALPDRAERGWNHAYANRLVRQLFHRKRCLSAWPSLPGLICYICWRLPP